MKFPSLMLSLICGSLILAATGCSSLPMGKFFGKRVTVASPENPAIEVVCLWEPSEGRDMRGLPSRGLRGQIMFFTRNGNSPVVVNGDVKIYQFDNYGPREGWDKPVHQFEFSAEQWNSFLQSGMLGPTYHVFIPYMRKHPEQVNVALQLRFTPRDGSSVVYSKNSSTDLPGLLKQEAAQRVADRAILQGDADPAAKQAVIGRSLGIIPPSTRTNAEYRPPIQQLSYGLPEPRESINSSQPRIRPEVTILNAPFEEETPADEDPPRRQFRLAPSR